MIERSLAAPRLTRQRRHLLQLDLHYVEPRLVALYDQENPRGADTDFYLRLADDYAAQRILDLGCGTGLLTRELAGTGRQVTGVDPSPAMLAYARQQPGAARVAWIEGDASALGSPGADLALMTGNVAQIFLDEDEWLAVLRALHDALRPGGYLAFESRNPEARAWEGWHREATYACGDTPFGPLASWLEVTRVAPGRVSFAGHNLFMATGEVLVAHSTLRFRSQGEIAGSLREAGFKVRAVYGGWQREPMAQGSRVMVFLAQRPTSPANDVRR